MNQETEHYKGLYEQGCQIIDAMDKQNDELQSYIQDLEKEPVKFADFIKEIGWEKYKEGWCQAGGSNGWHCTTEELYLRFREQDKPTNK